VSKRAGAGYTNAHEELSGEKAEEYFNAAVTEGGRALNSSRICVVGQGRAGKTALARALSSQPYEDTESTIGVKQSFLEVNKVGLCAGDGGQWNVLGDGDSTVMSAEEALARCAAQLIAESATPAPDRTKVSSSMMELLEDQERPPDSYQSASPVKTPPQTGLSSRTPDLASNKTVTGEPANRQQTLKTNREEVIKRMNMQLSDLRSGTKEPLRISLWDYGGQEKFYVMHHMYLSRFCVYLLVFSMKWLLSGAGEERVECLEYLRGWLNSILMHGVDPKDMSLAPILMIGTHKDEVPNPQDHAKISKILDDNFQNHRAWHRVERFKKAQVKDGRGSLFFFPVDNTRGQEDQVIKEVQSTVLEVVGREKYVNAKVPYPWLQAYQVLQKETDSYLPFEKVKDICCESGMGTNLDLNDETIMMLKWFTQMGLVMYHDEKGLKDLVVIDPARFLVEPASCVICQHDMHENDALRAAKSQKPHLYQLLRKGILTREMMHVIWSDVVVHRRDAVELLMTKYQLILPLANEDENDDRFLVPALLLELPPKQVESARLVGYFIFGHPDIIGSYRKRDGGYVSVEDVKREGFLPKGLFAAVLGSIVSECQRVHGMSFSDMETTTSCISTGFGRHQFELRQLLECNMMQLILMVDSPLLVFQRLLELMQVAAAKLTPSLRFAICIDQDGGACSHGRVATPPTGSLVVLDGEGGLEERLAASPPEDIKVARGQHLSACDARKRFGRWLMPLGLREWYHIFLSYRWSEFDTELVKALFSTLSVAVTGQGQQVHVFLDRNRLEEGRIFSSDFANALIKSLVVVPILSSAALDRMFDLKSDSNIDNVLLEWMLIVVLLARGHLKFCFPIMVGEVNEDAKDGKFISNLFSDGGIDKLPEVVCTKVADRVNELLVENRMAPLESVHTYTVRETVKKITGALGLPAWEMNARLKQQQSKLHAQMDWKKSLYRSAASKVLEFVDKADRERPAHIVALAPSDKNTPCEIVAQPHPIQMELQATDAAAEIERIRYVCPL
jgi:NLR family CARD domain-containing protein 3